MGDLMNDNKTPNEASTINSEKVDISSYGETDNPEVEAVVQFYERKIGIFENTLDLFKQNLMGVNSRFNTLRIAYRPLKEAHEKLTEEYDALFELNHNMSMELKKKSTIIELERNRANEQESQIKNYEKTFEKHNSIFSHLNMNVLEMLKDINSENGRNKWKLVSFNNSLNKSISIDSVENEHLKNTNANNNNIHNNNQSQICSNESSIGMICASQQQESLEIQFLPQMDVCYGGDNGDLGDNEESDIKQSTPLRSPSSSYASASSQQSAQFQRRLDALNPLEVIFEQKRSITEQLLLGEESQRIKSMNDSAMSSSKFDIAVFGSPNLKLLSTYDDQLGEYKNENGSFLFIPDNDYFRVRTYVCSDDINWDEESIFVRCPRQQKRLNRQDSNLDSYNDFIKISFNCITYECVHDIPSKQPIDGVYVLAIDDDDNDSPSLEEVDTTTYTYQDIISSENSNRRYKFIPNLQYSYLNGIVTIPKFFKNLIPTNNSKMDYSHNCGDDIWPFRQVVYSNYQSIPSIQPIGGYYVFVHHKNFNKKSNERGNKLLNRRSMKPSAMDLTNNVSTDLITKVRMNIDHENTHKDNELLNKPLEIILNQINNKSESNRRVLSVIQHEEGGDNRDKSFAALPQSPTTSVNEPSDVSRRRKKRAITLRKHKSLINPFIQLSIPGKSKETTGTSQENKNDSDKISDTSFEPSY